VLAEAVTNAAKHGHCSHVQVGVRVEAGAVTVEVRDDEVGGANPSAGSGLRGLADRGSALGGMLEIESPAGEGTTVTVRLTLGLAETRPDTNARHLGSPELAGNDEVLAQLDRSSAEGTPSTRRESDAARRPGTKPNGMGVRAQPQPRWSMRSLPTTARAPFAGGEPTSASRMKAGASGPVGRPGTRQTPGCALVSAKAASRSASTVSGFAVKIVRIWSPSSGIGHASYVSVSSPAVG
jgi:hypothetical protein